MNKIVILVLAPFMVVSCSAQEKSQGSGLTQSFLQTKYELQSSAYEEAGVCLNSKGWEISIPSEAPTNTSEGLASVWVEPDEETGYGISFDPDLGSEGQNESSDVFQTFLKTLSEAEQDAFESDLEGCQVTSIEDVELRVRFDELEAKVSIAEARVAADPDLIAAWRKWSGCFSDSTGIPAANQQGITSYVGSMMARTSPEPLSDGLAAVEGDDVAPHDEAESGNAEDVTEVVTPLSLGEVQELELDLAAADNACFVEHVGSMQQEVTERVYEDIGAS